MKLKDIHRACVEIGIKYDVRPKKRIDDQLEQYKEKAKEKKGKKSEFVDDERFWNPYYDSRIIRGTGDEQVKRLFVGVDVDVDQLLVVDRLRERGKKIDAVMLHHPQGRAKVELAEDMLVQIDLYRKYGVPVVQVEQQLHKTLEESRLSSHSENIFVWEKTAEFLDIAGFCCHTPADNLTYQFLEKGISRENYLNVGELINALLEVPEFERYAKKGLKPECINCSSDSRTGRVAPTGINGGTDGPPSFVREQAEAGVGTLLVMHADEEQQQQAKDHNINIIQLNHYAGDELSLNLMLDLLQKKMKGLDVIDGCGFERYERSEKELKMLTGKPKKEPTDDQANS